MRMATLQIKNFPDELHARLQEWARLRSKTMSAVATEMLQEGLSKPMDTDEWLEWLDRFLPVTGRGPGFDTAALVNAARDEDEDYRAALWEHREAAVS
jgi:hypothetical protein